MNFIKNIAIILVISIANTYAQQSPILADYHYNPLLINPAYSGFYLDGDLTLNGRSQINGIKGSPTTINLTYHTPVGGSKTGLGGIIIHDKIGVTTKTGGYITYAYKLDVGYNDVQDAWYYAPQRVSFGLITGMSYYQEDLLSLNMTNDPEFQENTKATVPSVGFGIAYNSKHFYIGFSSPNLLEPAISSGSNINVKSNYYIHSGIRIYTSRYMFLEPSILFKYTEGAPSQTDINLVANYLNKVEFGVGYRTSSSLNILAGFYLNQNFRIMYNYSPAMNDSPLGHSHGLTLGYRFGSGYSDRRN